MADVHDASRALLPDESGPLLEHYLDEHLPQTEEWDEVEESTSRVT